MRWRRICRDFLVIGILIVICCGEEIMSLFTGVTVFQDNSMCSVFSSMVFHGLDMTSKRVEVMIVAFLPVVVFQILYANFMYKDLHGNGLYSYVRYSTMKQWFAGKVRNLICADIFYFAVYTGGLYMLAWNICDAGKRSWCLNLYMQYVCYLVILAFWSVLLINLLSVWVGNVLAFVLVYSLLLLLWPITVSALQIPLGGSAYTIALFSPVYIRYGTGGALTTESKFTLAVNVFYAFALTVVSYRSIRRTDIGLINESIHI